MGCDLRRKVTGTASQADLEPHSPTSNALFCIPQLSRILITLDPSKSASLLLTALENYHSTYPHSDQRDVECHLQSMTHT
jgi:hypothetical protein